MRTLNQEGRNAVAEIATRYKLTPDTVEHMLMAVSDGAGTMAQFNCAELGGSGQWMRGGMTMVGDMFNHGLKATVDQLCNELSALLVDADVFVPRSKAVGNSGDWWPEQLGKPHSVGAQNSTRYAVFSDRLAVNVDGDITVYDTLDHHIGGVSQQQGGSRSLTFSSQHGTIPVDSLPVVSMASIESSAGQTEDQPQDHSCSQMQSQQSQRSMPDSPATQNAANTNFATPRQSTYAESSPAPAMVTPPQSHTQPGEARRAASPVDAADSRSGESGTEIVALIEQLAKLHGAGILNDEEFSAKKKELLARL